MRFYPNHPRPFYPGVESLAAQIAALFANSEQGAWYERRDLSTEFQDSAGTTPVTVVEQPVGRGLDKSGRGNYATQPTSASRPVLSARANNILATESLTAAPWTVNASTISAGFADPLGGTTAFRIVSTAVVNSGIYQNAIPGTGNSVKETIWLRGEVGGEQVQFGDATNRTLVTLTTAWQKVTATVARASAFFVIYGPTATPVIQTWYVWHPDDRSVTGTIAPDYQRVTTATDYDTAGFPKRIDYDGVDDSLVTTFPVSLGSACTVGRSVPVSGASILTAQTIGTTYTDTADNCGLVIINRALTTPETANLTAYLNQLAGF